ncbi:site-specific integrase [Leuconostoc gasicomitatum]|uniref:site-specific integrase n=1 Tax=Leuconostoc gasicomitatum TaxID=115778 RepID=UPI001CC49EB8|nr:site-specific integrase [Leuconostoc gasicomitatum]MBZ5998498.1 site-specific integrase [Leuconostoc gasicomitatum]
MASIYKRGTSWTVNVSLVTGGKRIRKTKSGFKTKREAGIWATGIENKKNNDELSSVFVPDITVPEYFGKWLEIYKGNIKSSSMTVYLATLHTIERSDILSTTKAFKLTRARAQEYLNEFGTTHGRATTAKRKTQLKSAYQDAVLDGLIRANPFERTVVTGSDPKDSDLKFLETEEYLNLINETRIVSSPTRDIILIGALTGARIGEILALTTDDIKDGIIDINKTEQSATRKIDTTKTKNSIRQIDVPVWLTEKLLNKYHGKLFNITQVAVNKAFKKLQRQLEFKNIVSFHGLRHTHASYLVSQDISIEYISKRLGHADTTTTMRIYAHLLHSKRQQEVKKTIELFK